MEQNDLYLFEMTSSEYGKSIDELMDKYCNDNYSLKSILGIDVYKYSQYKLKQQTLIPLIFNALYKQTIYDCMIYENFFFDKYKESDFIKNFIATGDGGFHIFDNPLQALIFSCIFHFNLKKFNTSESYPKIKEFIDEIDIRYTITYDKIFKYDNNFFGSAIINNSRILSKDKLNRFLLDENVVKWFNKEINSLENLQILNLQKFKKIDYFSKNDFSKESVFFKNNSAIKKLDLLKIGKVESKDSSLNIYNLHVQFIIFSIGENIDKKYNEYVVTIGNLNVSGIN